MTRTSETRRTSMKTLPTIAATLLSLCTLGAAQSVEIDKRLLRDRIQFLKKKLDKVKTHRMLYRDRRKETPVPVVSLVGYTNAGKSSLLNALTAADVYAEDQLFATLDPTTRR